MAGHPWEMTLRQFLAKAKAEYGLDVRVLQVGVYGLVLHDESSVMSIPAIEEDDVLRPEVLEHICYRFGLPAQDFGLDPDPED
ncbi:MAG TPA: hypothetical protein VGS22_27420 [Thermoanaerobaculia bacterium]|jgi:hypothetical protein|nr:hypothetical protein [Thermoanaerobaculia bacterium]